MNYVVYINILIVLLFALIWVGAAAYLRFRVRRSLVYLFFFTVLYVYIVKVLDYTLFQFQTLLLLKYFIPGLILNGQTADEALNLYPIVSLTIQDLQTSLLNILLFIPFGFGLPFITRSRLKLIVVFSALFSFSIELVQFLTGYYSKISFRVADINDVIFNTAGAAIGCALFVLFMRFFCRIFPNSKGLSNPFLRFIAERAEFLLNGDQTTAK